MIKIEMKPGVSCAFYRLRRAWRDRRPCGSGGEGSWRRRRPLSTASRRRRKVVWVRRRSFFSSIPQFSPSWFFVLIGRSIGHCVIFSGVVGAVNRRDLWMDPIGVSMERFKPSREWRECFIAEREKRDAHVLCVLCSVFICREGRAHTMVSWAWSY